jgi:multiple sugar transport system permease protein
MLILLGGLNSISPDVHDAAEVDGANFPRKLWNVIIPLLKPFFVVTLLLRFIYVFTTFDIIMSLTKGGPGHSSATLYFIGYLASFEFLQMGRGATWNLVIFIITMVVSMLLVNKALKRD